MKTSTSTSDIDHAARAHSDVVGGSSAERILNCPASYAYRKKLPEAVLNKSSVYADEGSALHEAMEYILENDVTDPETLLGMVFGISDSSPNGFKMTRELIHDALTPCLDFFDALCDELEAEGGMQFLIEKQCQLPGIPGAFGTSDIIFRTDKRSGIVDWKFGAGKPVSASVEEDGKLRANSQLAFYARAGAHTLPAMFETDPEWPVDLYIVQPRSRALGPDDPIFTHYQTTMKELEAFRWKLVAAVAEATGPQPRCKAGPWCEFQPCRTICPAHTGPLLDLSKLDLKKAREAAQTAEGFDWGEFYSEFLALADSAEATIRELQAQAFSMLEAGHPVPGWKLVEKRASEFYVDPDGAKRHAIGLGAAVEDVMTEPELKSPAQLGAVLEPLVEGKTKKDRLAEARAQIAKFTDKKSSGLTLARDDDRRPEAVATSTLMQNLADKLNRL